MQPKVSMVMPCYNKVKYIGGMLNSVIAQKWDNIELILVNDGSTDGTREVITEYEPKIKARGYEVVIIDQENMGVAGAVRNGLMRVTGEYICQVDADDELDPEYVSTMAKWLCEHPEDMAVACDYNLFPINKYSKNISKHSADNVINMPFEQYFLNRIGKGVCHYLIRIGYLKNKKILENFCINPNITQEWQIVIPLFAGMKELRCINSALYNVNTTENSIIQSLNSFLSAKKFIGDYIELAQNVLSAHRLLNNYTCKLLEIQRVILKRMFLKNYRDNNEAIVQRELVDVINNSGFTKRRIRYSEAERYGFQTFHRLICNKLLGYKPEQIPKGKRIIGYSAYGKAVTAISDLLLSSEIAPEVFWDIAAENGDTLGGRPIEKPHFESLTENDVVLIMLKQAETAKGVNAKISLTPAKDNVWYYIDVMDYIVDKYYNN